MKSAATGWRYDSRSRRLRASPMLCHSPIIVLGRDVQQIRGRPLCTLGQHSRLSGESQPTPPLNRLPRPRNLLALRCLPSHFLARAGHRPRGTPQGPGFQGGTMLNPLRLTVLTAALLSLALPARAQELPDGKGKEMVAADCNSCHTFFSRVGAGYTAKGWRTVLRMMVNQGVAVPADQLAVMTRYLSKNFPEKGKPAGVVIPGPVKISIKKWQVPTPGSRPHDPLAASDGSLWYTGQMANVLGRLDPKTGRFKEYPLTTPHSGPHGLVEDKDGNIWYTGNTGALIGKLDPKTGAVSEYKMPDPEVHDPHTLIFDASGILWFTAQNSNRVGRLDPKSGEIKLLTPPTPKARPYGMALNSKGTVFFVEFGANKVGSVDPKTLEIREYPLPDAAARPRRIAITSDDIVWYS